jgi:hypothetical protein
MYILRVTYKTYLVKVHTDCRLFVEFSPFEESVGYRIRHWAIELRTSQEFYRMPKDGSMV